MLLAGVENRVVREKDDTRSRGKKEEISKEKIKRAIGKLKDGKATRTDGIPNEV